jgi:hypothetical protein
MYRIYWCFSLPRRRPEQRKGLEKRRQKFNLSEEGMREAFRREDGKGVDDVQGDAYTYHPKAFGTPKKIPGAKWIGKITNLGKTTHWHVDRREKEGTAEDRKKKT